MQNVQKRTRATNATLINRNNKLREFLTSYKTSLTYDEMLKLTNLEYIKDKEDYVTIKELYQITCSTSEGLFKEKLTFPNFRYYMQSAGYTWNNKTGVLNFETNFDTYHKEMALHYLLQLNPYHSIFRLPAIQKKSKLESSPFLERCIVIEFTNNSYISAISELLYELYINKIRGITEGKGILRIYACENNYSKEILQRIKFLSQNTPELIS